LKVGARTTVEADRHTGSILVAVLWSMALLSALVVGVLYAASLNLRVVKNQGDLVHAHYLAVAGVEKAKALLFHDADARRRAGINHTGELYNAPQHFKDIPFGPGQFRVFHRAGPDEGHAMVYGISDEESRLHLNQVTAEILRKLEGIEPEAIASIVAYRDEVQPFRTTRELLMVRGVSRHQFLGDAANDDWRVWGPEDAEGRTDLGWSGIMTVHSSTRNVNALGEGRVHLQGANEQELAAVPGISPELAKAIVESRGRGSLDSLVDLLEVTASAPDQSAPPPGPQPARASGGPSLPAVGQPIQRGGSPSGERLISQDLLMRIADSLTPDSESAHPGLVNINTAQPAVLATLPSMNHQLARAIVAFRQSNGFFANIAELLQVTGMNADRLKELAPHVTARSETFRIVSEGTVMSTGARRRIEAIVRIGSFDVETLSYRENL
jgi:DNA uptake protein ComE-like DNA-binding protein